MTSIISAENISKKYQLYQQKPLFLKGIFGVNPKRTLWALKDVSFAVGKGEMVGIIGNNGSGKSTLARILAGITYPTTGFARARGKMVSLLELGAGFHYELTGRENIYLNGTLMGLTKKEIDSKFDSIAAFSGVEQFIDTAVQGYSSGMFLRLGFAIAIHLEPEILLIDEVLTVGDYEFQQKCLDKIQELREQNVTIILISHNLDQVRQFCDRVIWLEQGRIALIGRAEEVIAHYLGRG
ncbi:MAG: ABC transporter ATP-binding protein [Parcubacteria group bacterium]|nr:ABC transporter ATP-binding protein [Parcubacteria group bacterium]